LPAYESESLIGKRSGIGAATVARSPRGEAMAGSSVRILVVGYTSPSTQATLKRLEREGWSSHCVNTIAEAEGALKMIRFDVVLAGESIGNGSGYDLTDAVLGLAGTLLVSVALSEASLWLPVVQRGTLTLGDRALNSAMLESEVVEALKQPAESDASSAPRKVHRSITDSAPRLSVEATDCRIDPEERRGQSARNGIVPKMFLPPRRKSTPAASAAISVSEDKSAKLELGRGGVVRTGATGRRFR
jgi:hypothetical protein